MDSHKGNRILIVEDDESFKESLSKMFKREGYEVWSVPDGEKAIKLLGLESIDLVITDLYLPGMQGLDLIHKIRGIKKVPILVLTAFGDWESYRLSVGEGIVDYLNKPVKKEDLLDKVKKALGG